MGLYVVVSDQNPDAPGLALADDCLIASTYDVRVTVEAARRYHQEVRRIDGVICMASDVPVTVASVAETLGLPGIPVQSAQLATDKLAMKKKFAADGVPVPWYTLVDSADHLRRIVAEREYPLVLKPVDSRGGRGVLRLTYSLDLDSAYNLSLSNSPTGRVMAEHFLEGPQVSTESIVLDGVAYTPGFSDRNYEYLERYAPHMIENGGELPSKLSGSTQRKVREVVDRAAGSMGIVNGVVKGDIVVCDGQPHVIELAARLSGGYFCTHEIPLNTGVDFVGNAIRLALGETVDPSELQPKYNHPVAQRYFFPAPGTIRRVSGIERFSQHPDVRHLEIRVSAGDTIGPMDSHPARAGVVMTTGQTRAAAIDLAKEVVQSVKIETVPS